MSWIRKWSGVAAIAATLVFSSGIAHAQYRCGAVETTVTPNTFKSPHGFTSRYESGAPAPIVEGATINIPDCRGLLRFEMENENYSTNLRLPRFGKIDGVDEKNKMIVVKSNADWTAYILADFSDRQWVLKKGEYIVFRATRPFMKNWRGEDTFKWQRDWSCSIVGSQVHCANSFVAPQPEGLTSCGDKRTVVSTNSLKSTNSFVSYNEYRNVNLIANNGVNIPRCEGLLEFNLADRDLTSNLTLPAHWNLSPQNTLIAIKNNASSDTLIQIANTNLSAPLKVKTRQTVFFRPKAGQAYQWEQVTCSYNNNNEVVCPYNRNNSAIYPAKRGLQKSLTSVGTGYGDGQMGYLPMDSIWAKNGLTTFTTYDYNWILGLNLTVPLPNDDRARGHSRQHSIVAIKADSTWATNVVFFDPNYQYKFLPIIKGQTVFLRPSHKPHGTFWEIDESCSFNSRGVVNCSSDNSKFF